MLIVPALTLWLMAIVRLPAAVDPRRAHLFRATVFAATACTLHISPVYYAADPVLGGHNTVGLVTLLALLLGFWQFHAAIVLAVHTNDARRRHRVALGNAAMAASGVIVTYGFLISHVDRADQNLPITYGDQFGMQLFLWAGTLFIVGTSTDIMWTLRHKVSPLRGAAFRAGFLLIGLGIVAFLLMLADRLMSALIVAVNDRARGPLSFLDSLNGVTETLAVILIGIGVALPRLGRPARQIRRNMQLRWLLLRIHPTWRRMTLGIDDAVLRSQPMSPFDVLAVRPARRLNRRVIEIRDCEFKRPDCPLTHNSVALLNHIEDALTRY
ncbi:DUF6545 domain-containing protein [Arthrobacter sp. AQ5-05]|uniref:DUF6545 domain-containing protein n=1 Tax=Arthrobacter sp. AQ5-05 TaxID=2184581 RepID=UPI0012B67630|nr:DUF6545 domain-containing protein [Arthrobacter sp. AQ5-05]